VADHRRDRRRAGRPGGDRGGGGNVTGRQTETTASSAGCFHANAHLRSCVRAGMLSWLSQRERAERVAFVLHDMFDVPFAEISPMVGRSEAAARQLASRARRQVHQAGYQVPTPARTWYYQAAAWGAVAPRTPGRSPGACARPGASVRYARISAGVSAPDPIPDRSSAVRPARAGPLRDWLDLTVGAARSRGWLAVR
jgi:hypothetical protein